MGTGHLDEAQVRQQLLQAAQAIGLDRTEALATVNSGLAGGARGLHEVGDLNRRHAVVTVQGRTLVMNEERRPAGGVEVTFSTEADFRARYRNRRTTVPVGDKVRQVPLADHWLRHPGRRQYEGLVFDPSGATPASHFNLWRGFAVEPREGDCQLFLDHVREVICEGDDCTYRWVLSWMADAVQNPARKPGTAIVMRGKQGTGKGVFARAFGSLFGQHFKHVTSARHLTGNFNAHLKDAMVVFADEAVWAGDKSAEGALKAMVTEPTHFIELKGKDPFQVENHVRLIMASNHDWVVPAGMEERRFLVLDVSDAHMQNHDYFAALDRQMEDGGREALLHHLLNLNLTDANLRQVPRTEALLDQKLRSMDPVTRWWYERLVDGAQTSRGGNWQDSVERRLVQDDFIEHARQVGVNRRATVTELGAKLLDLVPGLCTRRVSLGAGRSRVYEFPPLAQCRDAFEAHLGQRVDWPEEPEPTDLPAPDRDDDLSF